MKRLLILALLLAGCQTTTVDPVDCTQAQATYNALCAKHATYVTHLKAAQAAMNKPKMEEYGDSIVDIWLRYRAVKSRYDSLGCQIISCE